MSNTVKLKKTINVTEKNISKVIIEEVESNCITVSRTEITYRGDVMYIKIYHPKIPQ